MDEVIDQLLTNSRHFERGFAAGNLPTRPARRLAIVSCMDSRIDLFALLGLKNGEAHVIRNAGGIVTDDVLRSLTLSRWLLGTQHVFVIQHTRCGLHGLAEKESQGADRKRWVRSSVRLRIFRRPRRERAAVGAHAARIPITGRR